MLSKAVKIHVVERQTAVQFAHDAERRAERVLMDIEAVSDAWDEAGFTGAPVPR